MKNYFVLLVMLSLVVFGCRKDTDVITTTTELDAPIVLVTSSILGKIIDEDGDIVPNALVRIGNKETTSNELGLYQFQDIQVNSKGTYIQVSHDGYFLGSDRIYPANQSTNFSRIQLLRKTSPGSFDNAQGGTVNVTGAEVTFEPNSLVDAQGNVAIGNVIVEAKWIDPTAQNLGDIMPGGLLGTNLEGRVVTMTSFGMLAVELYDALGNELSLGENKEAILQFPVPQSLRSIAPETIPLWYFDEEEGIWREEGSATFEAGKYIGRVSHFTFWNVDYPYGTATVDIEGCIAFEDGSPAAFKSFSVHVEGVGMVTTGITDDQGNFGGPIPTGETLVFNMYDACGAVQEFTVGLFTENTVLTECLTIENIATTINGTLVDCDGQGIDEGILVVQSGWPGEIIVADVNGDFTHTFVNCTSQEFTITAYDFDNAQASEPMNPTISNDTDLGTIAACNVLLENFLISNADGLMTEYDTVGLTIDSLYQSPDGTNFYNYSLIKGAHVDNSGYVHTINLELRNLNEGTYTGEDIAYSFGFDTAGTGPSFTHDCPIACSTITVNITTNEGPGGFLEGDYSGTSDGLDSWGIPVPDQTVSGSFRVKIPD